MYKLPQQSHFPSAELIISQITNFVKLLVGGGGTWTLSILRYFVSSEHMSRIMRKPNFCICENKDADQLRGNCEADQGLCFRYTDSTIPLLPKFQASNHLLWLYSPVSVRPGPKPRRPVFSQRGSYYNHAV